MSTIHAMQSFGGDRQESRTLKSILFVAGLVGIAVGAGILLFPIAFYATNDIALGGQTSLLNEVRGSGGAIFAVGLYVLAACFVPGLRYSAALISAMVYLGYGSSRVLSYALDGTPAIGLIVVTILEFAIGAACLFAALRYRDAYVPRERT